MTPARSAPVPPKPTLLLRGNAREVRTMIEKMLIDPPATWALLLSYLRSRRDQSLAEAALLEEQIRLVEEAVMVAEPLPTAFNPNWKEGARLTTLGRRALETAFDRGMRQSEVARLFRISMTRAHSLHRDWRRRADHRDAATVE